MYCQEVKDYYMHFCLHPNVTRLYGKEPVLEVKVTETKEAEGCYWGWWSNADEKFKHVYYAKSLVTMCFPYSIATYEERGEGKLVPVLVEVLSNSEM